MRSKFLRKENIATGTMAFYFERPPGFENQAGQSIDLQLVNPPETDAEGNTRAFSIASPPEQNEIMIATRMRDTAFKRSLAVMEPGTEVEIEGPFGTFVLEDESRPAVFLTGGIGVTPAHAVALDAAAKKLPHKIFLFYSNRTPADAAFLPELQVLESQNPNYRFIPTMTDVSGAEGWQGQVGRIDEALIRKHVPDLAGAIFYISGPAPMVAAMRQILRQANVPEEQVKIEEFAGY